jgi:hypothetical protein
VRLTEDAAAVSLSEKFRKQEVNAVERSNLINREQAGMTQRTQKGARPDCSRHYLFFNSAGQFCTNVSD